jgi:hypothetical protein
MKFITALVALVMVAFTQAAIAEGVCKFTSCSSDADCHEAGCYCGDDGVSIYGLSVDYCRFQVVDMIVLFRSADSLEYLSRKETIFECDTPLVSL